MNDLKEQEHDSQVLMLQQPEWSLLLPWLKKSSDWRSWLGLLLSCLPVCSSDVRDPPPDSGKKKKIKKGRGKRERAWEEEIESQRLASRESRVKASVG